MSADVMFRQPTSLTFATAGKGSVAPGALVVGITLADPSGRPQAPRLPDPVHRLPPPGARRGRGTAGDGPYCTVCRTGRVFSSVVDGAVDTFRLVGMDHWNAMFEDAHRELVAPGDRRSGRRAAQGRGVA